MRCGLTVAFQGFTPLATLCRPSGAKDRRTIHRQPETIHPPRRYSRLAEEEIDDPAAADVFAGFAAVAQDVGVVAADVLQRVRKDRQPVEGPLIVNALCDPANRTVVPREPSGVDADRAEGITEDAAEN